MRVSTHLLIESGAVLRRPTGPRCRDLPQIDSSNAGLCGIPVMRTNQRPAASSSHESGKVTQNPRPTPHEIFEAPGLEFCRQRPRKTRYLPRHIHPERLTTPRFSGTTE
jgi:hypothetical protein